MKYLKVWTNFKDVVRKLNYDEIGRLFLMMLEYAETGVEPEEFDGNECFLWDTAKRDVDMMSVRDETNRENGKKGGRPKTEANPTEPNEAVGYGSVTTETLKEKKIKESKIKESNKKETLLTESKEKASRFSPPTVDEVRAYCQERNNGIDPEYFVAYYTARDWVLSNGKKVKDWKSCVITWEKRDKKVAAQQYEQRDYSGVHRELIAQQDREMEEFMRKKPAKTVIAQQYEQRDYSGVQDEMMAVQRDEIAERLRQKYGGSA